MSRIFSIPPRAIKNYLYRCDNKFHIDSLLELYKEPEYYGFIYISGNEMHVYRLTVDSNQDISATSVYKKSVKLQKSQKKGGQSAARIGRLHDEHHKAYVTLMTEKILNIVRSDLLGPQRGLIIGGPAEKKVKLCEAFPQELNVLGLVTCETAEDIFVKNTDQILDIINRVEFAEDEAILQKFMDPNNQLVAYGKREINERLEQGNISCVIVHNKCECITNFDRLEAKCKEIGAQVYVVKSRTCAAEQFLKNYGGIGGLLRFNIPNNF